MSLTPSNLLCFALYSTSHAVQRTYAPLLDPHGMTYPQFLVLLTLWAEDGQSVGQIARALHLESNTLTPLLKRVEAQGLIQRSRSTTDERQVIVTLTAQGKALEAVLAPAAGCVGDRSGMDQTELVALKDEITRLRNALTG